jgi:regulator of sirC expression with transglutaminase-like and TPR domain
MSLDDAKKLVQENQRRELTPEELAAVVEQSLEPASSKSIILRMLSNLRSVAEKDRDTDALRRYVDTMLVIDQEHLEARAFRIDLNIRSRRFKDAIADIDWMLDKKPAAQEHDVMVSFEEYSRTEMSKFP